MRSSQTSSDSPSSTPRNKPNTNPSSSSSRTASTGHRKTIQGKITDMLPQSGKKQQSQESKSDTGRAKTTIKPAAVRGKRKLVEEASPSRKMRVAASPQARAGYLKKKVAADSDDEVLTASPAKRAKTMTAAQKSVRKAVRNLNRDMGSESNSPRTSPTKTASPAAAPNRRGRSKESIPSPNSSPTKSSGSSSSSGTSRGGKRKADPRKNYPIRKNIRQSGSMLNGTSDGEDNTPDSLISSSSKTSTPTRKKAAALVKMVEKQTQLNVKRRGKKK